MIARKLILPMLATLALSACAQAPAHHTKEIMPMNASAKVYRPYTLDEYPDLTPEEIGRRMLKLIDSLTSFDELSLARVQEVMRLRLHTTDPNRYGFGMHLPASDWYYYLSYSDNPLYPQSKKLGYQFVNKDDSSDMTPVCAMDFNAYTTTLKSMGFQEREDMAQYDTIHPPLRRDERTGRFEEPPPQFRRLPGYFFSRGNFMVTVHEQREADAPDDKLRHACVKFIGIWQK